MGTTSRVVLASIFFGLLAAACGGSSSAAWEDFDRTYLSVDERDGFVRGDGVALALAGGTAVGDIDAVTNGLGLVMIYSFETSGISSSAVVESAVLRVYQEQLQGTPYADLGSLVVDHVQIGADLDGADYDGNTLVDNIGTLSDTTALEWKTLDVTAAVQSDVTSGRPYSEFRLLFTTESNSDAANDTVSVSDGGDTNGWGHIPELVVTYRAPRL